MIRKIILGIVVLATILGGWFYYYSFGKPVQFLNGLGWSLTPRHHAIVSISSISWLKVDDTAMIKRIFPDLGEIPEKKGFFYVLNHTAYVSGGYGGAKPEPPTRFQGITYTLRFEKGGVMQWTSQSTPKDLSSLGNFHGIYAPLTNVIFKPLLQPES